jgi:hypothetical protein
MTTVCKPTAFSSTKKQPTVYLQVSYVPQKIGEYFLSKVKFGQCMSISCVTAAFYNQLTNTTKSAFFIYKLLQNLYTTSHCQHL